MSKSIGISARELDIIKDMESDQAALALGIDKDLAALKARYKKVAEALKWSVHARHEHHMIGVLADEVSRLRLLLPHQPPKGWT
jgi:hypothetical protein